MAFVWRQKAYGRRAPLLNDMGLLAESFLRIAPLRSGLFVFSVLQLLGTVPVATDLSLYVLSQIDATAVGAEDGSPLLGWLQLAAKAALTCTSLLSGAFGAWAAYPGTKNCTDGVVLKAQAAWWWVFAPGASGCKGGKCVSSSRFYRLDLLVSVASNALAFFHPTLRPSRGTLVALTAASAATRLFVCYLMLSFESRVQLQRTGRLYSYPVVYDAGVCQLAAHKAAEVHEARISCAGLYDEDDVLFRPLLPAGALGAAWRGMWAVLVRVAREYTRTRGEIPTATLTP